MTMHDLVFFIAGLVAFFGFALAVQMRLMAGMSLRRAAREKFPDLEDGPARFAVVAAVNGPDQLEAGDDVGDAAKWLAAEYPRAIDHIKRARKATLIAPALIVVIALMWRLTVGLL
ncbi:hypothetical protein [Henriciella aquimarina]|uniref:hypothetical protein n=1 Tax=Henriciella aquimarina TaxID=545261 RepID=UPI000A04EC03|nr:hypothetical protein [Henriciella aquimarina]